MPIPYISALRVLATILVILIHASTGYLNHFDAKAFNWNYANTLNSFSRFSIPIFVMISGALLLGKKENTLDFYKKRLAKICIPFAIWTLIYLIYYFYRYTPFIVLPFPQVVETSIQKILHGASAHLWFLYMIVGLYLAIPFLRMIVHQASQNEMVLLLALWAASLLIMNNEFNSYLPAVDLTVFSGYIGYLFLGYFLAKKDFNVSWWLLLVLAVAVGVLNTWGTFLLSSRAETYTPTYYNYLGVNNALLSAVVFLFFKSVVKKPLPHWIHQIDTHSFGIYLVHIIILNFVHPLITLPVVWKIPAATICTLFLCLIFCMIVRKTPGGRYLVG